MNRNKSWFPLATRPAPKFEAREKSPLNPYLKREGREDSRVHLPNNDTASDSAGAGLFGDLTQKYQLYLRGQRGLSENTIRIYLTDVESFRQYLAQERLDSFQMDRQMLRGYLAWLATSARGGREGYARVSITRKLTALRSFYRFLVQEEWFRSSPVPSGRSFQVKV